MAIPLPDTAVLLGSQSVVGESGAHILWRAYASGDAPETVAAFYRRALGDTGLAVAGQRVIWRFPAERPTEVLDILPIAADGPHHAFRTIWPASARTAIVISHMSRPQG
jgi:hypothetical protein